MDKQAKEYNKIKNYLFLLNIFISLGILLFLSFSGASLFIRDTSSSITSQVWVLNGIYCLIIAGVIHILSFPLSFYEGFYLEKKFDLSNQTVFGWFKDDLKRALLALVIFLIIVEFIYLFLRNFVNNWWIFAALFWFLITVVIVKITPLVIIPLFYHYIPIKDNNLKQRICLILQRLGIEVSEIISIDQSAKSKKANAFISGWANTRRIVLTDTLLKNFTHPEIEAVVCHELGHYKHRDILKIVIFGAVVSGFCFYIGNLFLKWMLPILGIGQLSDIAGLPVLLLVVFLLSLVILPLQNAFSRYLEKKADYFSLQLTNRPAEFISMITKLGKLNLADFSPSGLVEFWLYDHPPISKRIKLAEDFLAKNDESKLD